MSTLAYSYRYFAPSHLPAPTKPAKTQAAPKSFWRRAYEAFVASQQARAEREVGRYLQARGGVLTDDTEREIMEHLLQRHSY
jgi:hypothetical protein